MYEFIFNDEWEGLNERERFEWLSEEAEDRAFEEWLSEEAE